MTKNPPRRSATTVGARNPPKRGFLLGSNQTLVQSSPCTFECGDVLRFRPGRDGTSIARRRLAERVVTLFSNGQTVDSRMNTACF